MWILIKEELQEKDMSAAFRDLYIFVSEISWRAG